MKIETKKSVAVRRKPMNVDGIYVVSPKKSVILKKKKVSLGRSRVEVSFKAIAEPLTSRRLMEMKKYVMSLRTSFNESKKIPVAMLLILGFLTPSLPFFEKFAEASGVNLIQNPSVETGTTVPTSWTKGKWGVNTATFTYPAPGLDGTKAVRIDMTAFSSGDAKWVFTKIPVTAGVKYVFSDSYISNVATEADIQYNNSSGTKKFALLGTYPASLVATTKEFTFTPATGVTSVTIFHLIAKVGYLITDKYSVTESSASDSIPPIVSMTSPVSNSSVTGTVTASATATDAIGISGVQFFLDGVKFGAEDVVSPYSLPINTTPGIHAVFATARDTTGNTATSSIISFTVTTSGGGGGGGGDTVLPTATITTPIDGGTVSATSTVSVNATDNVGVAGVTFLVDNVTTGAEDVVAPYDFVWDTASIANGVHSLTAKARDAANNTFTSSPVSVTVTNTVTPPIDTTLPVMTITAPMEDVTLSLGTVVSVDATDNVSVSGVTFLVDNVVVGAEDIVAPYDFVWDTTSATNGVHSLTAIARDAANNSATSLPKSVTVANVSAGDTTKPTVRLILPLDGTAVASTTPLSFGATDNIGVSGVILMVDGLPVGMEDITAPYDFLWNTQSYTNDSHIISAVARDFAGNIGTSTPVSLTVNNVILAPNLIINPLLETAGVAGDPLSWFHGSWGSSTVASTYPTIGVDGGKAATIEISNYVNGDAKWYFDNVSVSGGNTYSFTDSYLSTASTDIIAQYQTPAGIIYQYIASVPASSVWKTETFNVAVPAGVTALTIFHSIGANGTLSVDNFSLVLGSSPPPILEQFLKGLVSFSFDDGWITQYIDALPILNAAGFKGTFYIISQETVLASPTERILNPLLDTVGTNGDPGNWLRGNWGTNTATFTYPIVGADGGSAAKLDVTSYTDGDAKWYFGDTVVNSNEEYILIDSYKSDAPSVMTLRYVFYDGTIQYVDIATIPSSGSVWKTFTQTITTPANVESMTAFHLLRSNGSLTIDNYSLKMIPIYINPSQLLEFQSAGHEIGAHTQTHVSLSGLTQGGVTITPAQANAEIIGSKSDLLGMGVSSMTTMAYPYGDYNPAVETMTKDAGFLAGRSVDRGFNTKSTDKFALKIQQMDRTTVMTDVHNWVAQAAADKSWLILMFHQEDENPAHDLGVTPAFMQQVVDYVKTASVDVVTVDQGVAQMNP